MPVPPNGFIGSRDYESRRWKFSLKTKAITDQGHRSYRTETLSCGSCFRLWLVLLRLKLLNFDGGGYLMFPAAKDHTSNRADVAVIASPRHGDMLF